MMRNVDKVSFPYRASTHLNLLHVVAESGAWAKHGLDVNYNYQITKGDAHRAVASGEVEFVGGNHISTYAHRARGDTWVYLGQTMNTVNPKLVVRPDSGINGIRDLRGKKVGTRGMHPGLNDWLLLKQRGLDVDRDEVELVAKVEGLVSAEAAEQIEGAESDAARTKKRAAVWQWVRDGYVDAALLLAPSHLFAADAGLKVIDIEPLPMIWYTTISSSLPFVEKHPDIVERFLKGMIEGIHFSRRSRRQASKSSSSVTTARASSIANRPPSSISRSRRSWSQNFIQPWRRSRTCTRKPSARMRMPRRSIRWSCGISITSAISTTAALSMRSMALATTTAGPRRSATILNSHASRNANRPRWSPR